MKRAMNAACGHVWISTAADIDGEGLDVKDVLVPTPGSWTCRFSAYLTRGPTGRSCEGSEIFARERSDETAPSTNWTSRFHFCSRAREAV